MTHPKLRATGLHSEATKEERRHWGKLATCSVSYQTKSDQSLANRFGNTHWVPWELQLSP